MNRPSFHPRHFPSPENERRLIRQHLQSLTEFMDGREGLTDPIKNEIKAMEGLEGFKDAVDYYAAAEAPDFTSGGLWDYVQQKIDASIPLTPFDTTLDALFADLESADALKRQNADRKLQVISDYLQERSKVIRSVQKELKNKGKIGNEDISNPAFNIVKETFGNVSEAWSQSSGQGKLVIAAGVLSAVLLWRNIEDQKNTKDDEMFAGTRRFIGKTLATLRTGAGLALGAGIIFSAMKAVNNTIEKTGGRPLFNTKVDGAGFFPLMPFTGVSREEWNALKHKQELQNEWERLRTLKIPAEKISAFAGGNEERVKLSFGITNLCSLSAKEARELYEKHRDIKQIGDDEAPRSPFPKDFLTPAERYNLLESLLDSLDFIDVGRGDVEWLEDPNRDNQTLMYLIMDFNNPKLEDARTKGKKSVIELSQTDKNIWHYNRASRCTALCDGTNTYLYNFNDRRLKTVTRTGAEIDTLKFPDLPTGLVAPAGYIWEKEIIRRDTLIGGKMIGIKDEMAVLKKI